MRKSTFTKKWTGNTPPLEEKNSFSTSNQKNGNRKTTSRLVPALTAALIVSSIAFSVTGCGGSAMAVSSQSKTSASAVSETAAFAMDTAVDNSYMADSGVSPDMEMGVVSPVSGSSDASSLTSSNPIQPISTTRKLIRTVDLNVETTDFDQLIADVSQNVTDVGGYIEQSDISGSSISGRDSRRYAHFTARVPADKLDNFITQVGQQGNITNKSEYTQDVTLQYSDIESRKKSLTIEQERLWALLEKADTLEAVIALEERLSEIRYQLESFESQLRTYDNQVDYSTVSIYISEVQVLTSTAPATIGDRIEKGFHRDLEAVSRLCVNLAVWFLSSIPSLLLLAVLILLLIFIGRKLHIIPGRKIRKRIGKNKDFPSSPDTSAQLSQMDAAESSADEQSKSK